MATVCASTPCVESTTSNAPSHAVRCTADFIRKVDVPRRVDEVELIIVAVDGMVHSDRGGFDGDAALALEVHVIEKLFTTIAIRHGACRLQQTISKGALAMVDVCDD